MARRCTFCISAEEAQILAAIASGEAVEAIGPRVYMSTSTVRYHLARLMKLTGTNNRASLISLAFLFRVLSVREWPIKTTGSLHMSGATCSTVNLALAE